MAKAARPPVVVLLVTVLVVGTGLVPKLANCDRDNVDPVLGVAKPALKSRPVVAVGLVSNTGEWRYSLSWEQVGINWSDICRLANSDSDRLFEPASSCGLTTPVDVFKQAKSANDDGAAEEEVFLPPPDGTPCSSSMSSDGDLLRYILARSLNEKSETEFCWSVFVLPPLGGELCCCCECRLARYDNDTSDVSIGTLG